MIVSREHCSLFLTNQNYTFSTIFGLEMQIASTAIHFLDAKLKFMIFLTLKWQQDFCLKGH